MYAENNFVVYKLNIYNVAEAVSMFGGIKAALVPIFVFLLSSQRDKIFYKAV